MVSPCLLQPAPTSHPPDNPNPTVLWLNPCPPLRPYSPLLTGVDPFDLARLEAAVSAIPPSAYKGEQAALTQASQSMVFRWACAVACFGAGNEGNWGLGGLGSAAWRGVGAGQGGPLRALTPRTAVPFTLLRACLSHTHDRLAAFNQQQRQQYPAYGAGQQQQQQYRGYQQQAGGYQQQQQQFGAAAVGSLFRPPPPAFRGSYTAASSRNVQVRTQVDHTHMHTCTHAHSGGAGSSSPLKTVLAYILYVV